MAVPAALQKWLAHVKDYQHRHPGKTWRQCLMEAKKTYKR